MRHHGRRNNLHPSWILLPYISPHPHAFQYPTDKKSAVKTGVVLNKGSAYALQIDGLITLTCDGSFSGNGIVIENASDVEVFSSNALGAINGQGYITRLTSSGQNARLFRFISCTSISIHDLIFVDSPTFHLMFNSVSNMEAYHITIRGSNIGGTDGIDVVCAGNCYLHHITVTNRDECICVKSPSKNVLIEDIYCNQSGGMSIGSLTADGLSTFLLLYLLRLLSPQGF
jgi:rhamnogalacturonan hydrolase